MYEVRAVVSVSVGNEKARGQMIKQKMCLGFGVFERRCPNKGGHPKTKHLPANPVWCERCDILRMEHLNRQFAKLKEGFAK